MTLIAFGTWYLYVGAAIAIVFITFGLGRFEENAQDAWIFRALLIPGVLLIWPLVIWRVGVLWRGENKLDRHKMPRKGQERATLAFIFAIPLIILVANAVKQDINTLPQPVFLEATK